MDRKDVDTAVAENIHLRGLFGVVAGCWRSSLRSATRSGGHS